MNVSVNGVERSLDPGTTLAGLVAEVAPTLTGVAVAVDEDVVSRGSWERVRLHEGARVEILTAMQGG